MLLELPILIGVWIWFWRAFAGWRQTRRSDASRDDVADARAHVVLRAGLFIPVTVGFCWLQWPVAEHELLASQSPDGGCAVTVTRTVFRHDLIEAVHAYWLEVVTGPPIERMSGFGSVIDQSRPERRLWWRRPSFGRTKRCFLGSHEMAGARSERTPTEIVRTVRGLDIVSEAGLVARFRR